MVPYLEIDLSRGQFWTGLTNPTNEKCDNGNCVNKLIWDSDGSYLNTWEDQNHGIRADFRQECLRYRSDEINDMICSVRYYYICEFKCSSTTTITTTTTTSTTLTTTTAGLPATYGKLCGRFSYALIGCVH